jgi:hypothetical protein
MGLLLCARALSTEDGARIGKGRVLARRVREGEIERG